MINRHLLAKNARENAGGNALIMPANRGITGALAAMLAGANPRARGAYNRCADICTTGEGKPTRTGGIPKHRSTEFCETGQTHAHGGHTQAASRPQRNRN